MEHGRPARTNPDHRRPARTNHGAWASRPYEPGSSPSRPYEPWSMGVPPVRAMKHGRPARTNHGAWPSRPYEPWSMGVPPVRTTEHGRPARTNHGAWASRPYDQRLPVARAFQPVEGARRVFTTTAQKAMESPDPSLDHERANPRSLHPRPPSPRRPIPRHIHRSTYHRVHRDHRVQVGGTVMDPPAHSHQSNAPPAPTSRARRQAMSHVE